ncbi:MAG: hypothetical protein AAFO03_06350 [Bacteroidota bacterium]
MRLVLTFGIFLFLLCSKLNAQCDLVVEIISEVCDDNGTPTDPTDDINTVTLEISGSGPGGWTTTDEGWPNGAGMDGTFEFGPYPASAGGFTIIILVPDIVPDCFQGVFVSNFACDQGCEVTASVTGIFVDDSGTPSTCTDDTYTVAVLAGALGTASDSWRIVLGDGQFLPGGLYGEEVLLGPYPIYRPDGTVNTQGFLIADAVDLGCQIQEPLIVEPPADEGDCNCELFVEWTQDVDDNGTPEFCFDDIITITATVNGINESAEGWVAQDNRGNEIFGSYGEPVVFGPYAALPENILSISIADAIDPACTEFIFTDLFEDSCAGDGFHFVIGGEEPCAQDTLCVPIFVVDFQNILGLQLSVNYSNDNLQFIGIEQFNPALLGWGPGSVGRPMPQGPLQPGNMTFTWNDPLAGGVTLPDGDTLVVICFERIPGTSNDLEIGFSSFPTPIEIINTDEMEVPFQSAALNLSCAVHDLALNTYQTTNANTDPGATFDLFVNLMNEGNEAVTGIEVTAPIPSAFTFQSADGNYDDQTGIWQIDNLSPGTETILSLQLTRQVSGDSLFLAEVSAMNEPDTDSTPNNGVDTNGDNHFADDPGDEDDGDGWIPCSVITGTFVTQGDTVCSEAPILFTLNDDASLPDGYLRVMALYESPLSDPASFLAVTTGTEMFLPEEADPNRIYYLRLVAGPDDGSGGIDFKDNCVRLGDPTTVMWRGIVFDDCPSELILNCVVVTQGLFCPVQDDGLVLEYEWYLDGEFFAEGLSQTVSQSGMYELIVTDQSYGCTASRFFSVTEDFATPLVTIEQEGNLCGPDQAIQLTAMTESGNWGYSWNTGENSPSIIVMQPGLYTVYVVSTENGCITTSDIVVEPAAGECNILRGRAVRSEDCVDLGNGLSDWLIEIIGEQYTEYHLTNELGEYEVYMPTGTFNVRLIPRSPAWNICEPDGYTVVFPGTDEVQMLDLPASPIDDCALLETSISVGNLRRCSQDRIITVAYENVGTADLVDGVIALLLPEDLTYASTNGTFLGASGDSLFFAPQLPLAPGEVGQFTVYVDVNCNAIWGSTACVTALGLPYGPCPAAPPEWSGGSVLADGECTEEDVVFTLRNAGSEPLSPGNTYIIIQDGVMLLEGPEEIPVLLPGQSIEIPLPANGSTYVLEAQQEPFHPGFSNPTVVIEGCGTNEEGTTSLGFANQLHNDEEDFYIDVDCRPITAAYDPNDKQAEPFGYGEEHYILPDRSLEYTIRFQNTGNDTAQTVIIRDTLSEFLDLSTLRAGVSSHPYRLQLDSANAIAFVFEDILLPDSTTNLEASQGFVEYIVRPRTDTPLGTRIENTAAIYFDVNPPIFTNTTFHTLERDFIDIINWVETPGGEATWRFSPNPTTGILYVSWEPSTEPTFLVLTNAWGQEKTRYSLAGGSAQIDLHDLHAGWYSLQLFSKDGALLGAGKLVKY